jgi:hypothetical protein
VGSGSFWTVFEFPTLLCQSRDSISFELLLTSSLRERVSQLSPPLPIMRYLSTPLQYKSIYVIYVYVQHQYRRYASHHSDSTQLRLLPLCVLVHMSARYGDDRSKLDDAL